MATLIFIFFWDVGQVGLGPTLGRQMRQGAEKMHAENYEHQQRDEIVYRIRNILMPRFEVVPVSAPWP